MVPTKPSSLSQPTSFMISAVVFVCLLPFRIIQAQGNFCDVSLDASCEFTEDEICDSLLGDDPFSGCEDSDCLDCNVLTCGLYDFDCFGCLEEQGCFWCPKNGRCYNSNEYELDLNDICGSNSSAGQVDFQSGDSDKICKSKSPIFSDPLYDANAWAFDMIKVTQVWEQGIFGKGVRVRINDSGVIDHVEFDGRYDKENSCDKRTPSIEPDNHGTLVASIIAAAGNNGVCSVGIAPEAIISSCNTDPFQEEGNDEFLIINVHSHDISQNSWGYEACLPTDLWERRLQEGDGDCPFQFSDPGYFSPCEKCDFSSTVKTPECEETIVAHCQKYYEKDVTACLEYLEFLIDGQCAYTKTPKQTLDNLVTGVIEGRNGKGIIYVFGAGNSYDIGNDGNMDGLILSRLSIAVGAVGKDGKHASYSTPGAPLFVTAPGGDDFESSSSLVAADVYDNLCTDSGTGTSFSSPIVSGVIALMLEVNEYLTWRDVQGIIAETSQVVDDDPDDDTLVVNGAGLQHSNFYGFGIIDAEAAVNAARDWTLYGVEKMIVGDSGIINEPIQDSEAPVNFTLTISQDALGGKDFSIESTVLSLDLKHFSRGDLEVVLTSPSGTTSMMHPGKRHENIILGDDERWKLMTVRNWGESPVGDWTLTVRDLREGDFSNCADAPSSFVPAGVELPCIGVEDEGICSGGTVLDDLANDITDNGMTMAEACCACGGGLDTSEFEDTLKQWRLFVYGRDPDEIGEEIPSSKGNETIPSSKGNGIDSSHGYVLAFLLILNS